ncbi:GCN5 family acetyltransferase [Luteipulveratus mongoliensis]|uniref:GCN5 family acetyltransferase n=1 Tax=Luteipulveratus mongoliensis TaxID=571913 RepID=A0A0K1JPZ0_9MICO|nr:GCN5 family acetyltransferase [Luteipulveratus mongoliensis]
MVTWPRKTERLTLRPARPEDIGPLLAIRALPAVTRWLIKTDVDPVQYRDRWLRAINDPYDHSAVVELDGRVIGDCGLGVIDGMGQPGGPSERSEGQIGYIFHPGVAGRGYATEAATSMVALAFGELGLRRVTAGCFADNLASVRVLEKIGMRREQHGVRDSWHAELGWIDGYTYGILAEEWAAR